MRTSGITIAGLCFLSLSLQVAGQAPSCNKCSSTYIPESEVKAYLNRVPAGLAVADQQIRAVDVGKANVAVAVVYRGKLNGKSPVAEHDLVSEVYHVIDGSATLVTGYDIEGVKYRPSTDTAVVKLNGRGSDGVSIRNGVTQELKAGDVMVIPAGVGHWFTKIDDHIRYLMVRVDPDKVAPLKDAAASKADLEANKVYKRE